MAFQARFKWPEAQNIESHYLIDRIATELLSHFFYDIKVIQVYLYV